MSLPQLGTNAAEKIDSVARIILPFPVQEHVQQKYNLGIRDSTSKVVYINMKAIVEEEIVAKDSAAFELS